MLDRPRDTYRVNAITRFLRTAAATGHLRDDCPLRFGALRRGECCGQRNRRESALASGRPIPSAQTQASHHAAFEDRNATAKGTTGGWLRRAPPALDCQELMWSASVEVGLRSLRPG